jgi:hypothetical protein
VAKLPRAGRTRALDGYQFRLKAEFARGSLLAGGGVNSAAGTRSPRWIWLSAGDFHGENCRAIVFKNPTPRVGAGIQIGR